MEILLDAGADVHAKGSCPDAFHAAVEGGHHDIITQILERGYSYSPRRGYSYRPVAMRPTDSPCRKLFRESSPVRLAYPDSSRLFFSPTAPSHLSVRRHYHEKASTDTHAKPLIVETSNATFWTDFDGHQKPPFAAGESYPLEASAAAGMEEVVKVLLDQEESLEISSEAVVSAMKAASFNGHLNIVELLIGSVAKFNTLSECISFILEASSNNPRKNNHHIVEYALRKASECGCADDEIAQMKLKMAERGRVSLKSDFSGCCASGNRDGLMAILECNQTTLIRTEDFVSGVEIAAKQNHRSLLDFLLDHRSFPQAPAISGDALINAIGTVDFSIFTLLASRSGDLLRSPRILERAVFEACQKGNPMVLEYLITNLDVDVNTGVPEDLSSSHSSTALQLLAMQGHTRRREKKSGPPSQRHLISPLQIVLRKFEKDSCSRLEEVVQLLLKHGADPNCLGGKTAYPIQVASRVCPVSVVKRLIGAGAKVALVHEGDSALASTVGRELDSVAVLKCLLEAGENFPPSQQEGKKLIARVLEFFAYDKHSAPFANSNGCFQLAPSLKYVFEEGPGAVLEILLRNYEGEKLEDGRYRLVLQMACLLGKKDFVELLVKRGVNVNDARFRYGCPLQAASRSGQTEIVRLLLKAGAKFNTLQGRWHTPIRAAIVGGHIEVVQLLLDHGADVKLRFDSHNISTPADEDSASALLLAIQSGNVDIVRALLRVDASVTQDDSHLPHPLIVSCQLGHIDITNLLLEANAPINVRNNVTRQYYDYVKARDGSPLHTAVAGGHASLVEMLLVRGADANMEIDECDCTTPLLAAIKNANMHIIQLLLDADADVNRISRSGNALSRAVRMQNIALVRKLISAGATVAGTSPHPNCLTVACLEGSLDVVELLLETVCSGTEDAEPLIDDALEAVAQCDHPNNKVMRVLLDYVPPSMNRFIQVCSSGIGPLVTEMLQQGLDVNGDDGKNTTPPLHAAARQLRSEVVQILVEQGAEVNYQGGQLEKPLMAALKGCAAPLTTNATRIASFPYYSPIRPQAVQRCTKIVQLLLEKGAIVDIEEGEYGNSLNLACMLGSAAMAKLLIENKPAIVNFAGTHFQTPLFTAIENENHEIVSFLLENGVDVNRMHQHHGTPLHCACRRQDGVMVRKLLQYGASPILPDGQGETALTIAIRVSCSFKGPRPNQEQNIFKIFQEASTRITFSDSDILAACNSDSPGSGILASLLDADKDFVVSEDLIVRFLQGDCWRNEQRLNLLLDRHGCLAITERILMTAPLARIMEQLLQRGRLSCKITSEILANQRDVRSMELLLRSDPETSITEAVVICALENGVPRRHLLQALWQRNPSLVVTPMMMKAAKSIVDLKFLLQRLGPARGRLQDVAKFVCENDENHSPNSSSRAELLACLIRHDSKIKLTALMVESILPIRNLELLDEFLTHEPALPATGNLFLNIFESLFRDNALSQFAGILHRHGKRLIFTQEIRDAIDKRHQGEANMERKESFYHLCEKDDME